MCTVLFTPTVHSAGHKTVCYDFAFTLSSCSVTLCSTLREIVAVKASLALPVM